MSTELVGRTDELARIDALLAEGARIVTLVGPPGVGKTCIARSFIERQGSAAIFCDLTSATTERTFVSAVAAALGAPVDEVPDALAARRPTVVVLDNFEQLPETSARSVASWGAKAPRITFLATSRTRLRVASERVVVVDPLPIDLAERLFLDVARAGGWDGAGADGDVRAIVTRLEGLPLAVVMAASRARAVGTRRIREELERSTEALGDNRADEARHHRSLRHAIEASLSLLEDGPRHVLARCGCFAGPFELADAEAILDEPRLSRPMERLVEASLVQVRHEARGPEYRMHVALREIVARELPDATRRALEQRHLARMSERARELAADMSTPALGRIARMEPDLRLAFERACELADESRAAPMEPDLSAASLRACEIACALARLVDLRGPSEDLLASIERAVALAAEAAPADLRARLSFALGYVRFELGDLHAARGAVAHACELAREAGDARTEAMALAHHATIALRSEGPDAAAPLVERAEAAARLSRDLWVEGLVLGARGMVAFERNDRDAARAAIERARGIHRRVGDRLLEAIALGILGNIAHDEGSLDEARDAYADAVAAFAEMGTRGSEGVFRGYLATVLDERGDTGAARAAYSEAIVLLAEHRNARFEALFRAAMGGFEARCGDLRAAREALEHAAVLVGDAGPPALAEALSLHRGQLDVALAETSPSAATRDRHIARACRRLSGDAGVHDLRSDDVRFARRQLTRALHAAMARHAPGDGAWCIEWAGATVARGEETIDLRTRKPLRALVWVLAIERLVHPGETVSADALIDAGWPDERVLPSAAAHRLRVALSTLRKLGLRGLLETRGEGYRFTPDAAVHLGPPQI